MSGGEAVFRVRTDILDLDVCAPCATEAGRLAIRVEPLADAAPSARKQSHGTSPDASTP
jgi:hypothetical protein